VNIQSLFLLLSLLLVGCGGGGDSKSSTPVLPSNSAPIISSKVSFTESSGNGKIETDESFTIRVKITDTDNDNITGTINLDDNSEVLSAYSGDDDFTHQATFNLEISGEITAIITVTDGVNSSVTLHETFAVFPNIEDVQAVLKNGIVDFVPGGQMDNTNLVGWNTDNLKRTLGYISTDLSDADEEYNAMPYGECGVNRPHKLLEVDVTPSEVIIPEAGVIFPLECLSKNQQRKIEHREKEKTSELKAETNSNHYISQNFLVNQHDNGELFIVQTGEGIKLEGHIKSISCGELVLINIDGSYMLTQDKVLENLPNLTSDSNSFELNCEREVDYQSISQRAPLLAKITGKVIAVDSTFPTGSIDNVNFSIPYLKGGLDAGSVCVTTQASDDNGIASEMLLLESEDGLTDGRLMQYDEGSQRFCAELTGFDGRVYFKQTIVDYADNSTEIISDTYSIEKNDAPVFNSQLPKKIVLRRNQGIVNIVELSDIIDPEGHQITLSGETSIDTSQSLGSYILTIIATDQYGAESTISITVQLAANSKPTASIEIIGNRSGEAWYYNGKVRNDNVYIVLGLSSNDQDGQIVSSILEGDLGFGSFVNIDDYSSTYDAGVLFVGGETLRFKYQVTDNEGKSSEVATLEFDVHENMPPIYQGQTNYVITTGACISIEKVATDPENDEILYFSIVDDDWEPCFNAAGEYLLRISMHDEYGAPSEAFINVKVED
jgi:hypothetical protein